jgi:putative ABC transport system ATP-binding protein
MALIDLEDVSKIYPLGKGTVTALADFNLTVETGEFTVLAGPSGSGKTSVLNLIGCLDSPSRGRVRIEGRDVGQDSPRVLAGFRLRNIGFIFQSYNLIPVLTAAENAEFTLMLQGVDKKDRRGRILRIFADLGIAGLEDRRPSELSGGQQQRVAIARALVHHPQLLVCDEPTSALDAKTGHTIMEILRKVALEGDRAVIIVTHDSRVIEFGDRIATMEDGHIISVAGREDAAAASSVLMHG